MVVKIKKSVRYLRSRNLQKGKLIFSSSGACFISPLARGQQMILHTRRSAGDHLLCYRKQRVKHSEMVFHGTVCVSCLCIVAPAGMKHIFCARAFFQTLYPELKNGAGHDYPAVGGFLRLFCTMKRLVDALRNAN